MIQETISQIQRKVEGSVTLNPDTRRELVALLNTLDREIADLSRTDASQAQSIAGLTEQTADVATRDDRDPQLLNDAADKLRVSVAGFENTHPRLVEAINRIATTLAGLGI